MSYSLHPGAEQDVADALDFYSKEAGYAVAVRFQDEFERVANLLLAHPDLGTPTSNGRRAIPLKIFPYLLIYRNLENSILILIVRHQHRLPSYAHDRQ